MALTPALAMPPVALMVAPATVPAAPIGTVISEQLVKPKHSMMEAKP